SAGCYPTAPGRPRRARRRLADLRRPRWCSERAARRQEPALPTTNGASRHRSRGRAIGVYEIGTVARPRVTATRRNHAFPALRPTFGARPAVDSSAGPASLAVTLRAAIRAPRAVDSGA